MDKRNIDICKTCLLKGLRLQDNRFITEFKNQFFIFRPEQVRTFVG